jgi:hypothetical protein
VLDDRANAVPAAKDAKPEQFTDAVLDTFEKTWPA